MKPDSKLIDYVSNALAVDAGAVGEFFKYYDWGIFSCSEEELPRYVGFLEQILFLKTSGISLPRLARQLEREKKLIDLIEGPQASSVLTEGWGQKGKDNHRLLLSRYDLGADLETESIQGRLDFTMKEVELFDGRAMGEDALKLLKKCVQDRILVIEFLRKTGPMLERTAKWAKRYR